MYVCSVLAAISDGRVVHLEIDTSGVDGQARRWCHINAVQSAMSNSLSNIGQTAECLAKVKLDSEAKDSVLEQLAIAGSLLHSHSTSSIHCSIVASADRSLSPRCRQISASLSNRARFTLGHNWTFLMSVSPASKCCGCKDRIAGSRRCKSDSHSSCVSCDVSGLSPGASESLSLVVEPGEHSSAEVSHIVETALIYTPDAAAAMKQVSVSLTTQIVDILDFVQQASFPATSLRSSRRSSFAAECHKLQQLCRPQVKGDSDSMSVDELELQDKVVASVKEHVVSVYASKPPNIRGTITDC